MPGLDVKANWRDSFLFQNPSNRQRIQRHNSLFSLVRFLASGLAFFAPLLLPVFALAADVTLAWDPNADANLEGYGIYFKKDAPGPPYDLFGYVTIEELSDPNNPTFTVTGLEEGSQYYFTATAYDSAGNESGYSNFVCAEIGSGGQIALCGSGDTGSAPGAADSVTASGGSGGGGGGGCFIETSLNHPNPFITILGILFCAMVLFMVRRRGGRKKAFKKIEPGSHAVPVFNHEVARCKQLWS
jgi:hypothetical protein